MQETNHSYFHYHERGIEHRANERRECAYISLEVNPSSLSKGWSIGIIMSGCSISLHEYWTGTEISPSSKDCFAIPREASLPAKFAYIPSDFDNEPSEWVQSRLNTRSIKVSSCSYIEHDAFDCEKDSLTVLTVERCQCLWCEFLCHLSAIVGTKERRRNLVY
jgi:hypothetical protein